MDKYQKWLLLKSETKTKGTFLFFNCAPAGEVCADDTYGSYNAATNCFLIKQDPNITKTVQELAISKNEYPCIETVQIKKKGAYTDVPLSTVSVTKETRLRHEKEASDDRFVVIADFNDRIDAIKLKFVKNIAEDLEVGLSYQEADKQAYIERQEILRKETVFKRAAIKHSVGDSLVNIYFQPCADNYDRTEILLFVPDKTETKRVGGPYGPVDQENVLSWSLILATSIDNGVFFKSISGLAYGRYAYIVKQFDKGNNLLLETDYIEFSIGRLQISQIEQGNIVVI